MVQLTEQTCSLVSKITLCLSTSTWGLASDKQDRDLETHLFLGWVGREVN